MKKINYTNLFTIKHPYIELAYKTNDIKFVKKIIHIQDSKLYLILLYKIIYIFYFDNNHIQLYNIICTNNKYKLIIKNNFSYRW